MIDKKGAEWVAWILATGLFVSISVMMIIWGGKHTATMTEGTVQYVEGKEQCSLVVLGAEKTGAAPNYCSTISVQNKGTISVKFRKRYNDIDKGETEMLVPNPELAIDLSIPDGTKKVELLPLVEIGNNKFASCTTKRLVITCP